MSKTVAIVGVILVLGVVGYAVFLSNEVEIEIIGIHEPISVGNYVITYLGDYKVAIYENIITRNSKIYELSELGNDQFDLVTHIVEIRTLSTTEISIHITEIL